MKKTDTKYESFYLKYVIFLKYKYSLILCFTRKKDRLRYKGE